MTHSEDTFHDMLMPRYNLYGMSLLRSWLKQSNTLLRHLRRRPEGPAGAQEKALLRCDCGEEFETERQRYRKTVTCPSCKLTLFVYPVSPYPTPPPPPQPLEPAPLEEEETAAAAQGESTLPSPAPEQLADPVVEAPAGAPPTAGAAEGEPASSPPPPPSAPAPVSGRPMAEPAAAASTAGVPLTQERRVILPTAPVRPWWQRRSVLVLTVSLVILATLVALVWNSRRARFRRVLVEQYRAGQRALQEHDLRAAIAAFRRVKQALGWVDQHAGTDSYVRHLTEEVLATDRLLPVSPHQLFDEYGRDGWQETFASVYRGGTVLIEAPTGGTSSFELNLKLRGRDVTWRLTEQGELAKLAAVPDRIVLIAPIEDVRADAAGRLTVLLDGEAARLITSTDLLQALAWPVDEQTEAAVRAQHAAVTGTERSEPTVDQSAFAPPFPAAWPWTLGLLTRRASAAEWQQQGTKPLRLLDGTLAAHELNGRTDLIGMKVRVYGKYKARITKWQLLLHQCDVRIQLIGDTRLPPAPRWLFVEGVLYKRNGFLVLETREVTRAPDPVTLFRQTAAELARQGADPAVWLRLARWAEDLARRYRVPELGKLAGEAVEAARRAEFAAVRRGDAASLRKLLQKYESDLTDEQRRIGWFRVLWWELNRLDQKGEIRADTWHQLTGQISRRLPNAGKPVRSVNRQVVESFRQGKPDELYEKQPAVRAELERLLMRRALARYLQARRRELVPEQWLSLVEEADRLVPDEPQIAVRLFDDWIGYHRDRLDKLSRTDVLQLYELIKKRDAERARDFLRAWLKRREALLPADDLAGRLALARDYQDLLRDRDAAIPLLVDIVRHEPTHPEASRRLRELGYRLRRGVWYDPQGRPVTESQTPHPVPQRSTPRVGDTAEEVRVVMGGTPSKLARIGTATGVLEVWHYEGPKKSIVVLLRVAGGRKVVEAVYGQ